MSSGDSDNGPGVEEWLFENRETSGTMSSAEFTANFLAIRSRDSCRAFDLHAAEAYRALATCHPSPPEPALVLRIDAGHNHRDQQDSALCSDAEAEYTRLITQWDYTYREVFFSLLHALCEVADSTPSRTRSPSRDPEVYGNEDSEEASELDPDERFKDFASSASMGDNCVRPLTCVILPAQICLRSLCVLCSDGCSAGASGANRPSRSL